ncbi:MAG: hypothetical protein CSA26_08075 [Desulfobacterales bacterium]|nr:MAG: hypothetical protein CSA26_08075 [Desulfobacterales bacterium]
MDGWDLEIGFKIPTGSAPELRIFAGWYDYDNPLGGDISGIKGRLELQTGEYFTLDAEVFEDDNLNGSNYFLGFRLLIPLAADFIWQQFRQGVVAVH